MFIYIENSAYMRSLLSKERINSRGQHSFIFYFKNSLHWSSNKINFCWRRKAHHSLKNDTPYTIWLACFRQGRTFSLASGTYKSSALLLESHTEETNEQKFRECGGTERKSTSSSSVMIYRLERDSSWLTKTVCLYLF